MNTSNPIPFATQHPWNFFARSQPWKARWIWTEESKPNQYVYFRRTFNVSGSSRPVALRIAAESRYEAYLNGKRIGRGSAQSQPFLKYYDTLDLPEALADGPNCLAITVYHLGKNSDVRGGLLAELLDAEGNALVATDPSWRALESKAWNSQSHAAHMNVIHPYQEHFDARLEPQGWRLPRFDDSRWEDPTVIESRGHQRVPQAVPWTQLIPRDIPNLEERSVLPIAIERVEESLDLLNRSRLNDLAPTLSQVGQPIRFSTLSHPESLLSASPGHATAQASQNHLDLDFDGVYAPAVVLDFGQVITARTILDLEGAAGSMVDIGYAERLIDGQFNIALECEFADRYVLKDGRQRFESFYWRSFRYLKLRFRNCHSPLQIHAAKAEISTFPFEEQGAFSSTDQVLQNVYRISRNTLRLCSNDFLMDTPWREQAQWLGDVAAVTVPGLYACFGDTELSSKFYRQSGSNAHPTGLLSNLSNITNHRWQGAIPDYSLWWIMGLWQHYLYTGQEFWIHRFYPVALGILYAHLDRLNADGLLEDMPYWTFIDWAHIERQGICGPYNAIFYGALEALASMAKLKSDADTAQRVASIRAAMGQSFHEALLNPDTGLYADARIDGQLSPMTSEHGIFAPILWELCDAAQAKAIADRFLESRHEVKITEAQPFFMTVILKALRKLGRADEALQLIRDRWGKRMVAKGATSVYEEWYANGSWRSGEFNGIIRTHSHAWSACPAEFLSADLIGLQILEPGCRRVSIAPCQPDFDYQVTYPTPAGQIRVEWQDQKLSLHHDPAIAVETRP